MEFFKRIATGRASCRICNEKIKKGMIEIVFQSYNIVRHCHKSCIDKLKITEK